MIIYINDRPCEAQVGDLLLKVAQKQKCHIGYVCGGNGICQSCFVYVKEGSECLSAPSDMENAFISDKLFQEGGRLACQSIIVKQGNLKVLSRAEYLRRLVLGLNVPGFVTYAQTIAYNVVNKLPDGASNILDRIKDGKMTPADSLSNIGKGLVQGSLLVADTFMKTFPFMEYPLSSIAEGTRGVYNSAANLVCNVSGGCLHLPGTDDSFCESHKTPVIESVKIYIK
ncbi:MAG: 2Fe-2S iron-sulfur cluster-binding protein [Chlorobium sp.]|jgi:chlorosome envelope protein J|nr:MAG: (2Fe-2S)-binding protein [Chlorobium sp.]